MKVITRYKTRWTACFCLLFIGVVLINSRLQSTDMKSAYLRKYSQDVERRHDDDVSPFQDMSRSHHIRLQPFADNRDNSSSRMFGQSVELDAKETRPRLSPPVSERVLQFQSGCQELRDQGYTFPDVSRSQLKHLIVNDEHKVLYCYIPKVACTNLKRVFLLLTGEMNETEPLKLKSIDVHSTYEKYLTFLNTYSEDDIVYKIKNYRKVIFVREPLERLLSAYRNKFRQKGGVYFQERFGRKIIRLFRNNASEASLDHGHDVTFGEFVQFLLDPDTEPNGFNEHWAPMSSLCHPCQISYDFIGKYESLDADVSHLLNEMSVDDQITFPDRGDTYKNKRTEDIMMEHFKTIPSKYLQEIRKLYRQDYILFGYPHPQVVRKLLNGREINGSFVFQIP